MGPSAIVMLPARDISYDQGHSDQSGAACVALRPDTAQAQWDNCGPRSESRPMSRPTFFPFGASLLLVALASSLCSASAAPPAEACTGIRHEIITVKVKASREDWTSAELRIRPNDVILVYAGGRLTIGGDAGRTVSAKGLADGLGALEMKVGTGTVVPAGTRWFGSFRDYGTLKFRIAAGQRAELAGSYKVNLVVIAAESFPDTVRLDDE